MSTKTSLRFLVIAGTFLNGYAVSAQNSFSTGQTLVANNTLKAELSGEKDWGNLGRNPQISAMPFRAQSATSIEIPVPPPLTQTIPNSSQVFPIQSIPTSSTVVPNVQQTGFIAPRSNPIPFTNHTAPTSNFTPFTNNAVKEPSAELIYPLTTPARISSRFGWRTHPLTGKRRFHSGLDIAAPTGAPVVATESGTIVSAGWNGGYGKAIVIQHNGTQQTLYGHLSEISVQSGQSIAKGTVIGLVGSTGNSSGPHLHFESRISNGTSWVAVDPSQAIQYAVANLRRSMPFARKDLPQGL
jgi:murein DD-endopeptidase MepM/ murein hydrolase activator NlpD